MRYKVHCFMLLFHSTRASKAEKFINKICLQRTSARSNSDNTGNTDLQKAHFWLKNILEARNFDGELSRRDPNVSMYFRMTDEQVILDNPVSVKYVRFCCLLFPPSDVTSLFFSRRLFPSPPKIHVKPRPAHMLLPFRSPVSHHRRGQKKPVYMPMLLHKNRQFPTVL